MRLAIDNDPAMIDLTALIVLCGQSTGTIRLDPPYGNILGGTGVMISGIQLFTSEDDDIRCIFDRIDVKGVYIGEQKALCISPPLLQTGRLPFQILINGSTSFSGESIFTSREYIN